ncbi:MAG TPA: trypsin-like serine protease [Bacteriovoracaceae bacterium]|nr:trypsin-like serine protease [Bacteriovoracaceae bacterium]
MNSLLVFLILVSLSFPAAAVIIGGKVAGPGEGDGVVQIATVDDKGSILNYCSATKVGARVLLTAAHCFSSTNTKILGISTKIINDKFEYEGVEVEKVISHPSSKLYNYKKIDVALVLLKQSSVLDEITTRVINFDFVAAQTEVQFWGFGCQATTNNTANYIPVKKHSTGHTQDQAQLKRNFGILTDIVRRDVGLIQKNFMLTPGQGLDVQGASVCWGDSGGPVFKGPDLVGINVTYLVKDMKANGQSESGVTDLNLHLRLSPIKAWLLENLSL